MAAPILQISHLTKRFGATTAIDGIDLSLNPAEIFGYIGPNGAGKTTTINILLGILKPTGGSASVFGLDAWANATEIHKRVSFVPGDVNLWPNLTGGEVIDLFTALHQNADPVRKKQLLERFDLDPSKKCRTYSKGSRQKVALIAALAADSDLYILDEPTSGLDPLMEQVFEQCIWELKEAGKTVFLSSHILSQVERLCDRVSIIREGKIIETGTMESLRHLTGTTMTVETERSVEKLEHFPGVSGLTRQGHRMTFQVEAGRVGQVIAHLAPYGVTALESAPPTLEDLFMRHYGGGEHEK